MGKVTAQSVMQSAETMLHSGENVIDFTKLGSIMKQGEKTETLIFVFTNMRLIAYKQQLKIKPLTRFIPFLSWFVHDEVFFSIQHEILFNDIVKLQKSKFGFINEGCSVVLKDNKSYLIWWQKQTFDSIVEKITNILPESSIQVVS